MRFKDRVAIVTGAAGGIGEAIALAFIREGAEFALIDVDKKILETTKNEIKKSREEVIAIACDIAERVEVKAMVKQVQKAFGRFDILVNNAGIIRRGTIESVTEEDWDRVIAVNLKMTFNCCKAGGGRKFPIDKGITKRAFRMRGPQVENFKTAEEYRERMRRH